MKKEEIMDLINRAFRVDGVNVRAMDVLADISEKHLVTAIALIIGKCE